MCVTGGMHSKMAVVDILTGKRNVLSNGERLVGSIVAKSNANKPAEHQQTARIKEAEANFNIAALYPAFLPAVNCNVGAILVLGGRFFLWIIFQLIGNCSSFTNRNVNFEVRWVSVKSPLNNL